MRRHLPANFGIMAILALFLSASVVAPVAVAAADFWD